MLATYNITNVPDGYEMLMYWAPAAGDGSYGRELPDDFGLDSYGGFFWDRHGASFDPDPSAFDPTLTIESSTYGYVNVTNAWSRYYCWGTVDYLNGVNWNPDQMYWSGDSACVISEIALRGEGANGYPSLFTGDLPVWCDFTEGPITYPPLGTNLSYMGAIGTNHVLTVMPAYLSPINTNLTYCSAMRSVRMDQLFTTGLLCPGNQTNVGLISGGYHPEDHLAPGAWGISCPHNIHTFGRASVDWTDTEQICPGDKVWWTNAGPCRYHNETYPSLLVDERDWHLGYAWCVYDSRYSNSSCHAHADAMEIGIDPYTNSMCAWAFTDPPRPPDADRRPLWLKFMDFVTLRDLFDALSGRLGGMKSTLYTNGNFIAVGSSNNVIMALYTGNSNEVWRIDAAKVLNNVTNWQQLGNVVSGPTDNLAVVVVNLNTKTNATAFYRAISQGLQTNSSAGVYWLTNAVW